MIIRSADHQDVPWLLAELEAFSAFYGTARPLFALEHARATLPAWIATPEAFPVFVAEHGGTPVGFIGGAVHPHLFNPAIRCLSELYWWVMPEHRGTSAGARLEAAFRAHGQALPVDLIIMTLEAASPVHDRALTRHGYRCHERSFLLEVQVQVQAPMASSK